MNVPYLYKNLSGLRETESIQNLFGRCAVLITDYSSVAFDMAYLNKALIYYQFDKEAFFSGTHTYQKAISLTKPTDLALLPSISMKR